MPLQVDIGYGDTPIPQPILCEYPAILRNCKPQLRVYAQETVIAEKLHAMVERGQANSRAKDFFDINFLSQQFPFEGESLTAAIRSTFLRRGRALPTMPIVAWTPAYFEEPTKLIQWAAFLRKTKLPEQTLPEVVARIERFLSLPVMKSITGCQWSAQWQPGGPWSDE